MTITEALKRVVDRQDLTAGEAEAVMERVMAGEGGDAPVAALLTALRMKGETADELTGFARVMRRKATPVRPHDAAAVIGGTGREALLDTCGTGGDVSGSFNVSTAAAFVVAGAGLRVAKHGNRSVSSRCGSADVMEALGVRLDIGPERIARCIDEVGIGFLHAPLLHGAMRHVAGVRRQLGIRTVFNMLGPLTNPAGANVQVIGVYAAPLTELLAAVLRELGCERAFVAYGLDGLDEISLSGETRLTELRDGSTITYTVRPEDFGMGRAPLSAIQGGDAARNAEIIRGVLGGEGGPCRDIVLMNAAAALIAGGKAGDFTEGVALARDSLDSGRALVKLAALIAFTNREPEE